MRPLLASVVLAAGACSGSAIPTVSTEAVEDPGDLVCDSLVTHSGSMVLPETLPPWQLPSSAAVDAHAPCEAGDPTRLLIKGLDSPGRTQDVGFLLRGPQSIALSELDKRAVPLADLMGDSSSVELVACDGSSLTMSRTALAEGARYLLVANRKKELKLVDRGATGREFKRLHKRIVKLRLRP